MPIIQAKSAAKFLDSLAVNTHVEGVGGYKQYNDLAKVIAAIKYIGFKHIRDGGRQNISKFKTLGAEGIKLMYIINPYNDATLPDATFPATKGNLIAEDGLTSWLPAQLVAAVGKENLDGLENINEVDINLWKYWNSTSDRTPINNDPASSRYWVKYLDRANRALWNSVKSNPELASLTVLPGSSGRTWTYNGKNVMLPMGGFIDYGNAHYYELEGGNGFNDKKEYIGIPAYFANVVFPGNMTGRDLSKAIGGEDGNSDLMRDCYERPFGGKPMYVTECGVHTGRDSNAMTYISHGKVVPRLFAEYFRLGFARSYWYELIDGASTGEGVGGRESSFGLFKTDMTPKPGAVQLKAMVDAIGETADIDTSSLDYTLSYVMPTGYTKVGLVKDVLLQKSNGSYILLVYHNVGIASTANGGQSDNLVHPNVAATLTLPSGFNIKNTTLRSDTTLPTATSVSNRTSYSFAVNDTVTILELTPVAATPTPAPTSYTLEKLGTNSDSSVTVETNGNIFLTAAGADIWGTSDHGSFYQKSASAATATTLTVRVDSFTNSTDKDAKAGIMIRESLASNSKMLFLYSTLDGRSRVTIRESAGTTPVIAFRDDTFRKPLYFRLTRQGSNLTASISTDGANYAVVYQTSSFSFASDYLVGLAATGHDANIAVRAKFDYVNI